MRAIVVLFTALLMPVLLPAQGRILPGPCARPHPVPADIARPLPCRPGGGVERLRSNVTVELADRVLRYEIRETFVNRGGMVAEADYLFPLPRGAAFRELQLSIGDEMVSGEVLDAAEARRIYETIVRQQRDPALVEWMGQGLLRARIFPIAPGEEKQVVVRFEAVAEREGDALRVDYLGRVSSLVLRYDRAERYGTPYSPTHQLDVRERGSAREVRTQGDENLVTILLPVRRANAAAVGVLAHRPAGMEDGFALLTVTPPAQSGPALPRDVTFVIDVSGSMRGGKLAQAQAAGRQLLASLDPGDRFRVIAFASGVQPFRAGWTAATREHVRDAERYLDALDAEGSTNISGALNEALDVPAARGRLPLVLFLTDGAPTVGERRPDAIARRAAELRDAARVFTFGVGRDVNATLLEQLALEGRGTAHFVRPEEDVERVVSVVASQLTRPVVTDLRVTADGVRLSRPHPHGALDLFAGQDLVLLARYAGSGLAVVRVQGMTAAGPVHWTTPVAFPARERENAFVARLWATQRVGWLSAERRRNGASPELDDEIRDLGVRYGIPTELASYLVLEPGMVAASGDARRRLRGGGFAASAAPAPALLDQVVTTATPSAAGAGERDFTAARQAAEQRATVSLAGKSMSAAGQGGEQRHAGGRTFQLRGAVWTDTRLADSLPVIRVRPYSAGYFALLDLLPDLREPFALGEQVVVAGRRMAIEVAPDAPERLDDRALARLKDGW